MIRTCAALAAALLLALSPAFGQAPGVAPDFRPGNRPVGAVQLYDSVLGLVGAGNPLPVSLSGGGVSVSSGGTATSAAPSYTNNSSAALSLDLAGNLRISCVLGCSGGGGGGGAVTQSGVWTVGLSAGSAAIGTVGVTSLPALPAGSAAIGTVGVTALPALPAGANAIGSVTVGGTVTTAPVAVTCTSRSGTITAGGTAQVAAAANAGRRTFTIRNAASAIELLNFDVTGTATAASFDLPPGAAFSWPAGTIATGAISVLGATAGHAYQLVECN